MDNNSDAMSEECEQDVVVIGYYTRSKRRKLTRNEDEIIPERSDICERKRKNPIMYLPLELLTEILQKISHEELGKTVRLVNRRFKIVIENLLNNSFKNVEKRLTILKKSTAISLAYTTDDAEIKCLSKVLSMLDFLSMQYNVTYATIWRYVYNNYYKANTASMYAGQLIDTFQGFLRNFIKKPREFTSSFLLKDYEFPQDIIRIVQLTKLFCLHFEKVNEEPRPECLLDSGCKMLDLIDSAKFIEKKTSWEYCNKDCFNAQYVYFFRNSWFIALPIKLTKELEQSQKQRMMHMRLRRIVLAHNDMFLAQNQYERDLILRPSAQLTLKKPGNNVYTGYGDAGDVFFYYGVMNEGAYIQKFNIEDDTDLDEPDDEPPPGQNEEGIPIVRNNNSEEDILYRVSHLGFQLVVTVKCPRAYAPWQYVKNLNCTEFQTAKRMKKSKEITNIIMAFECNGATYPHLPSFYRYDFCPSGF